MKAPIIARACSGRKRHLSHYELDRDALHGVSRSFEGRTFRGCWRTGREEESVDDVISEPSSRSSASSTQQPFFQLLPTSTYTQYLPLPRLMHEYRLRTPRRVKLILFVSLLPRPAG
jgi:hypothetical protein